MDKKIIDNIFAAWQDVVEKKHLDPVDDKANDKKFKNRKDKDIDNDGDVDSSDEFLHKKRKAIDNEIDGGEKPADNAKPKKGVNPFAKKESVGEDETSSDEPSAKDGMKKCEECGGSTENHDQECSKYTSSEKSKATESSCGSKPRVKEAVRHEDHGYGEIIAESDEGVDVLFAHGVEFNVPAEQLEGVSSAIKTAKRMGGNMTGATKKINKSKKGLADNPKVQKALRKANEEDEVQEEVQEGTVAELSNHIENTYMQSAVDQMRKMSSLWERAAGTAKDNTAKQPMMDPKQQNSFSEIDKDHDATNPKVVADGPKVEAEKPASTKQAPARGAADQLNVGDKKPFK
mgnify:CR=1 FL=1|tara:strand:- start:688 stop:1725 length:1038 start_codon:yes stop_codon:yes gene_type:complete